MGASVFCCSGTSGGDPCQFFSFHHITSLGTACGDSVFCSVTDFCDSSGTASGDPFVPFDFIASFLWAPHVATLVLSRHRSISVGTAMAAASSESRVIALIPARGGSVSIPKKNVKQLFGRPLIDWVICTALHSGIFAEVYVSTDDEEITEVAIACGAKVHKRAAHTATHAASTELAIQDFLDAHPDYDVCCLIQATSPLLKPADFCRALQLFAEQKADSLVTAVRSHRFLWSVDASTKFANAKNYDPLRRPMHEEWDGEFIENGAFYLFSKDHWDKNHCRLGGKTMLYEMEKHTLAELDSLLDWAVVSNIAADCGYFPPNIARPEEAASLALTLGMSHWCLFAAGVATGILLARMHKLSVGTSITTQ